MKRLMLTALMGCMLMGQVKAANTYFAATPNQLLTTVACGVVAPLATGTLVGGVQQLAHVYFMTAGSKSSAFFNGQENPQLQFNTFFDHHTDIPNLQSRFGSWINYFGKLSATMACGAAIFWAYANRADFANVVYGKIPGASEATLPHLVTFAGSLALTGYLFGK